MEKQYFLYPRGVKTEVSEEVYKVYYASHRKEKYQRERDELFNLESYHMLEKYRSEYSGEEHLWDVTAYTPEDKVELDIMSDKLHWAISQLTEEEKDFVNKIYFKNIPQREMARKLGVQPNSITTKKNQIIRKLKKLLEI